MTEKQRNLIVTMIDHLKTWDDIDGNKEQAGIAINRLTQILNADDALTASRAIGIYFKTHTGMMGWTKEFIKGINANV